MSWQRPLAVSVAVSVLYSLAVVAYSLLPSSNATISWTPVAVLVVSTALALVTVGVPVFVWLRYRIRSPGVLLGGLLVFWHVLVSVPPFGSGQGDSPGFLFVFVGAPLYLVAYGLLAALEYWLRGRARFASVSSS